jgi:sec-independent protein translocase protein TatB
MFDVGFSELILLAIVALVVLGPEKLPHAARVGGAWVARIRRSISTVQAEIEREVSAQELKTRMEKEFGAGSIRDFTDSFVSDIRQEAASIGSELEATGHMMAPALGAGMAATTHKSISSSENTAQSAPTPDPQPAAIDAPPASILADIARPLDSVDMDGEAAYRQWLDSQKRNSTAGIILPDQDANS